MATTIFNAVCEAPIATAGKPTGETGWRIAVQVLVASGGARVGKCHVGSARVSQLVWHDITDDVAGIDWVQGSKASGDGWPNPDVGVGHLLLRNDDYQYSPWNSAFGNVTNVDEGIDSDYMHREWAPSRTVRIVMFKPATAATVVTPVGNGFTTITRTDWTPLFTGEVEEWDEHQAEGSNLVTVTLVDPMAKLAGIVAAAVASCGSGDKLIGRIVRLLEAAQWPYPIVAGNSPNYFDTAGYTLQATTMTGNRLTELLLSAMSILATTLIAGNDGSLRVGYGNPMTTPFPGQIVHLTDDPTKTLASDATNFPAAVVATYTGKLKLANDPSYVANDITATRVGGTPQNTPTPQSIAQYGRRSLDLSGLLCSTDTLALYVTHIIQWESDAYTYVGSKGTIDQTIQPGTVTLVEQHAAQRSIQLGDYTVLDRYDTHPTSPLRIRGRLAHASHVIVPLPASIIWTTDLAIVARYVTRPTA